MPDNNIIKYDTSNIARLLAPEEISNFNDFPQFVEILTRGNIKMSNVIRIGLISDGSSILHAISRIIFKPYNDGYIKDNNGKILAIKKRSFINDLRADLAEKAIKEGYNEEFIAILQSNYHLDAKFHQFIANNLEINLLIIQGNQTKLYNIENNKTKNNKIIILHMLPNNYELVGFKDSLNIKTLFFPDHILVKNLL